MTERPRQLIDMWNIRIGSSYTLSGGDVFQISEFRYKSISFSPHWGRGDKISKPLSHKDRRPLKRAISQNSQAGTLKLLNFDVPSHRYHVSNVGMYRSLVCNFGNKIVKKARNNVENSCF